MLWFIDVTGIYVLQDLLCDLSAKDQSFTAIAQMQQLIFLALEILGGSNKMATIADTLWIKDKRHFKDCIL